MSAAEAAINNMGKAAAVVCCAPSGTATCPKGIIRVGVFFDGTGNNQWRDWDNGAEDKLNTDDSIKGPTNVAKLYRLYIDKGDIQKRIYHHGPGTDTYGDKPRTDHPGWLRRKLNATLDAPGMLLGAGGKERTEWGLKQLSELFSKNTNPLAEKKLVDIYGFSRGSAIGRDFVNRVLLEGIDNTKEQNGYRYIVIPGAMGGAATVRVPAYERHKHVIINFVGIFDTVASFNLGGKEAGNFRYNFFINHNDVKHTVHMIAEDEVRSLFPVSSLFMDPKKPDSYQEPKNYPNMLELWYPGAHSDVGGSYLTVPELPGKPAEVVHDTTDMGEFTFVRPAIPVTPKKRADLAHIPLRDMHMASVNLGVPLQGSLSAMGPACLWEIPGDLLEHYNEYDAFRANETGYNIGERYIQNFIVNDYVKKFHERAANPAVHWLEVNFMHDERMGLLGDKGEKHKRTVLYMVQQPKTNPKED